MQVIAATNSGSMTLSTKSPCQILVHRQTVPGIDRHLRRRKHSTSSFCKILCTRLGFTCQPRGRNSAVIRRAR